MSEATKTATKTKPVSMAGIRLVAGQYRSVKDNYDLGFATALECAKHDYKK